MCGERLPEQIYGRHLTTEDSLFVQLRRSTDVALVERLERDEEILVDRVFKGDDKRGQNLQEKI